MKLCLLTQPASQHVQVFDMKGFLDIPLCAALWTRGTPCVLTCANSYRLTWRSKQTQAAKTLLQLQHNSTHSHLNQLWLTSDTVGQQTPEHNLNSVPSYSKSINISTIWHGNPLYFWWWTVATISVWGTEILQGHANRHFAYPPQTDAILLSIYSHLFTSSVHLIYRPPESHHYWHNTLMVMGVRCVVAAATPPSPWDAPAVTQPQGASEEFSDTVSPTRGQMTPHTGAINKKTRPLSQMLTPLVSTFLCWTQHDNTTRWISMATHSAQPPWQHIVTQIFQMIYCQALDAFSFPKWLTSIKPNKHCERRFYMRRNTHREAFEDTSIKHLSSIQAQRQTSKILFQSFLHLWTLVFCFFPVPSYPFPSFSLCCSCVVSALFHSPSLHWPIVMPLTPPVWCRFGSVCLWTDSPLSNDANVLLCGQSTVSWKWASNSEF